MKGGQSSRCGSLLDQGGNARVPVVLAFSAYNKKSLCVIQTLPFEAGGHHEKVGSNYSGSIFDGQFTERPGAKCTARPAYHAARRDGAAPGRQSTWRQDPGQGGECGRLTRYQRQKSKTLRAACQTPSQAYRPLFSASDGPGECEWDNGGQHGWNGRRRYLPATMTAAGQLP